MRSGYDHLRTAFKQFAFNYDDDTDTCTLGSIKRMSYGEGKNLTCSIFYSEIVQGDPSPGEPWLGWLWFWVFHPLSDSAWADGKLAELAEQLGKMVEHPKSKSTKQRFARRCATRSFKVSIWSQMRCMLISTPEVPFRPRTPYVCMWPKRSTTVWPALLRRKGAWILICGMGRNYTQYLF